MQRVGTIRRTRDALLAAGLAAALVGCAGPAEPGPGQSRAKSMLTTTNGAPGYVHQFAASRFHLGAGAQVRLELGMQKVVGAEGAFATNPTTGAVRAILNGDAPAAAVPALTSDPAVHDARVVRYFVDAGLPQDQMGPAHVLTLMEGGGPGNVPESQTKTTFVAYTTVVTRVVAGIPVPDSFAAARFDQDDETTMEWVYWPPLPQTAIDEATKLAAVVADPTTRAAFLATLPPEVAGLAAEVTIRHADFADPNFVAFASYDVHDVPREGRGRGATRNFLANGQEVVHPNRRPNDVPAASDVARK